MKAVRPELVEGLRQAQPERIGRLLIANRGEIARRIMRTAHRMGLQTVAVYSDADAAALHVREATAAVALGGTASVDSYLRIDKLIAAARTSGADAVHPGYGFLSENADFARAVIDAGLLWVGPPPQATRTLGNKSSARQLAAARGIPCLPGYQGADQSDERFAAEAERLGYPVMVKAAAGGGGRGMRLVTEAAHLRAAVHSARSEAQSSFGSPQLLLERALPSARHVEVQIFADAHGRCIHLGERDCSVQRRHQKLIEEAPSPAVDAALRERMGRCAVELAQAAGYVGAGTVEFLLDASPHPNPLPGGEGVIPNPLPAEEGAIPFYMMEMNTRLQVEHPVTEAVTGLDLVEWQLRIAQGEPLPLTQEQVQFRGHAIEVRLCAEDEHYVPHAGLVQRLREPGAMRFDHALFEGCEVSPHYDSMLGKLIVHAPTRAEAITRLAAALDRTELLGLPSNRRLLAGCLRHPEFGAGRAMISFLERFGPDIRTALEQEERGVATRCAVAALVPDQQAGALPCPYPRPLRFRHRGHVTALSVRPLPGGPLEVVQDGEAQAMARPVVAQVQLADGAWHVQAGAVDLMLEDASFEPPARSGAGTGADELRAPFNGKVISVLATPGRPVSRGDTLVVIESMKLEHALAAARDGVVKDVHVEAGRQAATAQLLITFEAAL
jgi:3-methylcrotonyl-CoA carboxylase alpha subunit/geranyl-CoA carboxylase alpha subunit